MDNIADKIQSILTDEESLRQIQALYEALSGGKESKSPSEETVQEQAEPEDCPQEDNSEEGGGIPDFDFSTILKLQGLFGGDCQEDKNTALLLALKPHLSEEKRIKADKAIKIMHLINAVSVLKESGLLNDVL